MQFNVNNSPFNEEQREYLNRLIPTLTEAQKIWLCGFLSFPFIAGHEQSVQVDQTAAPKMEQSIQTREVTVLFGSETGNGQSLASTIVEKLQAKQLPVQSFSMDDFKPQNLKKVQDLLIITSTHGEGEPPENARSFYEFLHSKRAPKLENVRFSVLALGDESYEFFCQTGKDFDKRLEELGGERLYPRVDCDVDFEDPAEQWMSGVVAVLHETSNANASAISVSEKQAAATLLEEKQSVYSKKNPYPAEVLENISLNGRGSNKETRHLVLSLEDSGLTFEPGDSLAILPENDPELVDSLINELGWNPEESVQINEEGDIYSLRKALLSKFEITRLTKSFIQAAAELFHNEELKKLAAPGNEEKVKAYLDGRDLLDFVRDFRPVQLKPVDFIHILRKLPARQYSIASSLKATPDEVHLTISTVRFQAHGRNRKGVCSSQIAERIQPGDMLPIYVDQNPNFKLPSNPDTPIIMIGPGTGVAPFRAFLQEREAEGITGKSWLFFGDQHFSSDFLYQVEWQKWLKNGVLTKMDVAFSRDQAEKVYVQHRMLEKRKEFYQWLEEGAVVYVCGDEKHMARDVHQTILTILEKEGGLTSEQAAVYLDQMRKQKRYQRDVY
ncbi:assimilatory sulfite reductase (NADPH) flavoprotein subunit [Caldibacillus sp. 210928-DFI.2.22]|uniref:assimilatory sulfite reductase (NADPH) flavoprotein subunit n=1 Tax=unclassified Caldibacillus TaxID=2641266 RepID=UPI001D076FE3|nr:MULTISPECIES: assimilatory sulfite reductase (NADPH) flavoprotein subunit [unclassified Caldibacillus]MCB7068854.1 assimilatory sulfite reductase (NADPH) flavoprotein subunit [Caldibacillus sp. 210928-DFI.2.22]MCB7072135.1 assimilatory sulfite reductase (NADPH) flavoprotein subunit [Caldibacillus sp. 210928-DFI.2.18]